MSYDLFEVPSDYRADFVLIIAPYFDSKFVKTLVKKLSPNKILILVDDGIRAEDVQLLIKTAGGPKRVKVALAGAPGLVHIKGYYIEFVKIDGQSRRQRRFFYGSANATDAAFHGRRNAELIASVKLSSGKDAEFLNYIANVVMAVEGQSGQITGQTFGPLQNSSILQLPSFKVSAPGPAPGFDAWLQRGLLAAKYRESQQFLKISVMLQKRLPQDVVAEVFSNRGLIEAGERNIFRFKYSSAADSGGAPAPVDEDEDEDGDEAFTSPMWKSRYCTWTHLGDWLSDDCHRVHGTRMVLKGGDIRRDKIEELLSRGGDKSWVNERKENFLDTLTTIWKELVAKEVKPQEFFKGGLGGLDREYYDERFTKKLLADYRLAQDSEFRARYVDGYEFPPVPRFRQDTASWVGFVRSWCESVSLEASKRSPRSLLAKCVVAAAAGSNRGVELEPEEIQDWLRKSWNRKIFSGDDRTTVGDYIMKYHVE